MQVRERVDYGFWGPRKKAKGKRKEKLTLSDFLAHWEQSQGCRRRRKHKRKIHW